MGLKHHFRLLVLILIAVAAGMGLSGCDDHVVIDRDPSVPVHKSMSWAWRSASPQLSSDRRVVSRDGITPNRQYRRNPDWENDIVRNRITRAFEQNLNAKGLIQVSDPANADFLVDYQFGVQRRRERVATPVYPAGLVCGYYGCWNGFYGPPGVVAHTVRYHEGTIVFDLVDRDRNRLAYRAVRESVVTRKSFTQDEVSEGVRHLLKGLKPTK
jgi:hypothetical protein